MLIEIIWKNVIISYSESLKGYRNYHRSYKSEHVFHRLTDEEYLISIGAAGYDDSGAVRPTAAGLLMFGEDYNIVREFPEYFLDYREMLDPTIRWTDRVQSTSGDWTGNLLDFFFRVNSKIARDIKVPFKLEGITRVDDTPVHEAVREAIVNCLVNTDYFLPCGVVIKKEINTLVLENPGCIRLGKKQMLRGGISDPRNKNLMKMFNLIGFGERAGSGVPDIYQVWEDQGWETPVIEESYNPDRTRLNLSFEKKQAKKVAIKSGDKKVAIKSGDKKVAIKISAYKQSQYDAILAYMQSDKEYKSAELAEVIGVKESRIKVILKELWESNLVVAIGNNRNRKYIKSNQ